MPRTGMLLVAGALLATTARADFSETLTTDDYGNVDVVNARVLPGPELDVTTAGTTPVAVFALAGVPTLDSATLQLLAPAGPIPPDIRVVAFAHDTGFVALADANPPAATPLGNLDPSGSVDVTAAVNAQIAAGAGAIAFGLAFADGGVHAPAAFLGGARVVATAPQPFLAPPPLPGPVATPEPGSVLLLGLGATFALLRRRAIAAA